MKRASMHHTPSRIPARHGFRTGVSLHGHTHCSTESLAFLTAYKRDFSYMPAVLRIASWQHRLYTGEAFDIGRVTWRPPLTPAAAARLEAAQIESYGLSPLVSLTDHDDIESGYEADIPISLEWTVRVAPTFFHLGIHNLPRGRARSLAANLMQAAETSVMRRVRDALADVAAVPDTLVVFNHPLWDEGEVGRSRHHDAIESLLRSCGAHIHAFELNGLRPSHENEAVAELARRWGRPVISGGDRHGKEPNANINLTNAATFSQFAAEVRDRVSHVAFLPQYFEPARLRWLLAARDIVASYSPAESDAPAWRQRFFYEGSDGIRLPLSELWPTGRPLALRPLFAALEFASSRRLRPALRRVLSSAGEPVFA